MASGAAVIKEYVRGRDAVERVKKIVAAAVGTLRSPCAVFDIDMTVFVDTGVRREEGAALYDWLVSTYPRVRIVFATARTDSPAARSLALADLKSVGCWRPSHQLMLMPPSVRTEQQVSAWKGKCREEARRGEPLLMSCGDSWWDNVGEFTKAGKQAMRASDPKKFWVGVPDKKASVVCLKLPRVEERGT